MARRGRPRKNPAPEVAGVATGLVGPPEMPATIEMDDVAAEEWTRVVDLMGERLTAEDVGVLTSYAAAFAMVVHCRRELSPKSKREAWVLTTTTAAGTPKLHPLVAQLNSALRDLARFADALGLTPTARARVGQTGPPPKDAFDEFMESRMRKP